MKNKKSPKENLFKYIEHLPQKEIRLGFNSLRTDYLKAGRISYLMDMHFVAAINLGYAIESYLKQALIEKNNRNDNLQRSHDLKKLFYACQEKGIFNNVSVSEDFLDYSNSLFQMRYPSSTIDQCQKAYQRNNIIATDSDFMRAYDDFIVQLDEAVLDFTNDYVSSSIVFIMALINEESNKLFYHYNFYALKKFSKYHEIIKLHYQRNTNTIKELEKGPDAFWCYPKAKTLLYISRMEAEKLYPNAALAFRFPGEVIRDKNGNITHLKI